MKPALFSLLAGLVSLSLAGCTLSLIATPTPSPTPLVSTPTAFPAPTETPHIPIPDTIVDEVGAPSEIKQFAGSAESLQPMIDAIAKQLGFTPAEGELAGFTVTGAKGEGNYFFVSHEGTVYTLFAHAQGGRFATVKVDGANRTSDFAIFKMARFDRDAANVWWGIDDGQGGIIQPMFEFQLNGDGSITEVMFVEPKSGKSIQVSENTNQIQFESKVLFKLQEPLGGPEVAYMYNTTGSSLQELPPTVIDLLKPSDAKVWEEPTGYMYEDGTPVPWGTSFVVERPDGSHVGLFLAKVKGVIRVPIPSSAGVTGTHILPVYEIPSRQGGSNFIVGYHLEGPGFQTSSTGYYKLKHGIPLSWASGNLIPGNKISEETTFVGLVNGKQIGDLLTPLVSEGETILLAYDVDDGTAGGTCIQQIMDGELISYNGQSNVNQYRFLVSLFFTQ